MTQTTIDRYVSRVPFDAERTQLRTDFFLALDLERDLPPQKWMIRFTGFEQMRALTGVYDKYALSMFDRPGIRWKPFGPIAVGVKSQPPSKPVATAARHRLFDSNGSGLDCMDAHRRTSCGWRHGQDRCGLDRCRIRCLQNGTVLARRNCLMVYDRYKKLHG